MLTNDTTMSRNENIFSEIKDRIERCKWRNRAAFYEDGFVYTFDDVLASSSAVAANLIAAGFGSGDRLILALPDSFDFVAIFLGAVHIGAIPVPLNVDVHENEKAELIARADARLIVTERPLSDFGLDWVRSSELLEVPTDNKTAHEVVYRSHEDIAYGVYSSGTTGLPKIVFHTHGDIGIFTAAFSGYLGIGPGDVCISAARMCFAAGIGNLFFFPVFRGCAAILSRSRLTPERAFALAEAQAATIMYGPPSFYGQILADGLGERLSALRLAACGGAVLPRELERRLRRHLDDRLVNIFGSTEIGHAMIVNGPGRHLEGATGRVLAPYRARVTDDLGNVMAPGNEGRLEVAGPTIALAVECGSGSPIRVSPGCWYRTGDAATIDADGFVHVSGRLDDLEIVGGQNVHPAEIESVLLSIDQIKSAVVYSNTQPDGQPFLKALIVPNDARMKAQDLLEIVQRHTQKHLSWYKVPQQVEITSEIPLTTFGKIDRKAIRKRNHQQA